MSFEVPDAAVDAVHSWLGADRINRDDAAELLAEVMPHLRVAILAGVRERCENGDDVLKRMAGRDGVTEHRRDHLFSKAEGVRLAISYIDDAERMGA